jgi:hypothetical protein
MSCVTIGKTITITQNEYNELKKNSDFLSCLEACGVDNWHGYSDAHLMMNEDTEED